MTRRRWLCGAILLLVLGILAWLARPAADAEPGPTMARAPARRSPATAGPTWRPSSAGETPEEPEEEGDEAVVPDDDVHRAIPGLGILMGRVVDTRGRAVGGAIVMSPGCGVFAWADGEGWFQSPALAQDCPVEARRYDGLLATRSDELLVEIASGEIAEVELVLPAERTGGLGVQIREHDEGIEVVRVWPDTPAAEMGLEAGDLIVEVDGLPTATLDVEEFIEVMTGPEGTEVEFALALAGDTGGELDALTLTRAYLPGEGYRSFFHAPDGSP